MSSGNRYFLHFPGQQSRLRVDFSDDHTNHPFTVTREDDVKQVRFTGPYKCACGAYKPAMYDMCTACRLALNNTSVGKLVRRHGKKHTPKIIKVAREKREEAFDNSIKEYIEEIG